MYSKNGDFGLVKVKTHSFINPSGLFTFANCGWHKCNDKYRMDKDKSISDIIFVTVSGEGELFIDNEKHILKKDTVVFIPKNSKYNYCTPKGGLWEFYWLNPNGVMCDNFLSENFNSKALFADTQQSRVYGDIIESILKNSDKRSLKCDREISFKISEFLHLVSIDLLCKNEEQSLSEKAMAYLFKHKSENVTVDKCAKSLYVSPAHLIRVFKKETGITPHKYLEDERLKEASELILSSLLTLKEIAEITGFSSPSHFISAYKKKHGKTPREK